MKQLFKYDDPLDVVGVHGVGGALGAVLVGFFAIRPVVGGVDQIMLQITGIVVAAVYGFVLTAILGIVIHKTIGFTVSEHAEEEGLDVSEHGETAYRRNSRLELSGTQSGEGKAAWLFPLVYGPSYKSCPTSATVVRCPDPACIRNWTAMQVDLRPRGGKHRG